MSLSTVALWSLLVICEVDQDYVVAAHESTVGLVRNADITISIFNDSLNGNTVDPPVLRVIRRWSFDGRIERERYRFINPPMATSEGLPLNLGDIFEDGTTAKVLMNWDTEAPQRITPQRQGTVKAWYGPQQPGPYYFFSHPRQTFALFEIQPRLEERSRSLAQFVRDSPKVTFSGPVSVRGHDTWKLEMAHPDSGPDGEMKGSVVEAYLDPSVGYLIRKLVIQPSAGASNGTNDLGIRVEREITKFESVGDGAYFPVEAEYRSYPIGLLDGRPSVVDRLVGERIVVNSTLPADAMNFAFPEHALVQETPAVNGKYKVFVWGPDNTPARSILNIDELGPEPDATAQSRGPLGLVVVVCGLLGISVVAVMAMVKRRRAQ